MWEWSSFAGDGAQTHFSGDGDVTAGDGGQTHFPGVGDVTAGDEGQTYFPRGVGDVTEVGGGKRGPTPGDFMMR